MEVGGDGGEAATRLAHRRGRRREGGRRGDVKEEEAGARRRRGGGRCGEVEEEEVGARRH